MSGIVPGPPGAAYLDMLDDANLTVRCELWVRPFDPLTAPCWWQWREPCDCPDTSFGRNPHRWDCEQTPIYAELCLARVPARWMLGAGQ